MPLLDLYSTVRDQSRDQRNALQANHSKLAYRLLDVFLRTWDLGFTAFGGPPVHFQIIHQRFVEGRGGKTPWIDEQTYQELFAICQALPGPGSTKMLFCVVFIHAGFVPALFIFLIWSLPGAIGMYALSLGVQRINDILPDVVYAILSGLNSATVGTIALAAVQLADKAIKDKITRILVIFGACAGLCYNAIWYFPVLMVVAALATVIWDGWLRRHALDIFHGFRRDPDPQSRIEESKPLEVAGQIANDQGDKSRTSKSPITDPGIQADPLEDISIAPKANMQNEDPGNSDSNTKPVQQESGAKDVSAHSIPLRIGILIIIGFFVSFIAILVARGVVYPRPRVLDLFANMYLAGTIIFGGGPVVIPLLREYVVQPGWVSSRDFLLGLAIIQAFPGPNFNFAVYLGALSLQHTSHPTILGAFLGYSGIFVPGLTLAIGVQGLWRVLRTKPAVISALRGINATAVGLVFTAVYRLWEIGYLAKGAAAGQSLAKDPWWVVVAALTYAESAWFGVPPAPAIVGGAVLGLCWYGAVGRFR